MSVDLRRNVKKVTTADELNQTQSHNKLASRVSLQQSNSNIISGLKQISHNRRTLGQTTTTNPNSQRSYDNNEDGGVGGQNQYGKMKKAMLHMHSRTNSMPQNNTQQINLVRNSFTAYNNQDHLSSQPSNKSSVKQHWPINNRNISFKNKNHHNNKNNINLQQVNYADCENILTQAYRKEVKRLLKLHAEEQRKNKFKMQIQQLDQQQKHHSPLTSNPALQANMSQQQQNSFKLNSGSNLTQTSSQLSLTQQMTSNRNNNGVVVDAHYPQNSSRFGTNQQHMHNRTMTNLNNNAGGEFNLNDQKKNGKNMMNATTHGSLFKQGGIQSVGDLTHSTRQLILKSELEQVDPDHPRINQLVELQSFYSNQGGIGTGAGGASSTNPSTYLAPLENNRNINDLNNQKWFKRMLHPLHRYTQNQCPEDCQEHQEVLRKSNKCMEGLNLNNTTTTPVRNMSQSQSNSNQVTMHTSLIHLHQQECQQHFVRQRYKQENRQLSQDQMMPFPQQITFTSSLMSAEKWMRQTTGNLLEKLPTGKGRDSQQAHSVYTSTTNNNNNSIFKSKSTSVNISQSESKNKDIFAQFMKGKQTLGQNQNIIKLKEQQAEQAAIQQSLILKKQVQLQNKNKGRDSSKMVHLPKLEQNNTDLTDNEDSFKVQGKSMQVPKRKETQEVKKAKELKEVQEKSPSETKSSKSEEDSNEKTKEVNKAAAPVKDANKLLANSSLLKTNVKPKRLRKRASIIDQADQKKKENKSNIKNRQENTLAKITEKKKKFIEDVDKAARQGEPVPQLNLKSQNQKAYIDKEQMRLNCTDVYKGVIINPTTQVMEDIDTVMDKSVISLDNQSSLTMTNNLKSIELEDMQIMRRSKKSIEPIVSVAMNAIAATSRKSGGRRSNMFKIDLRSQSLAAVLDKADEEDSDKSSTDPFTTFNTVKSEDAARLSIRDKTQLLEYASPFKRKNRDDIDCLSIDFIAYGLAHENKFRLKYIKKHNQKVEDDNFSFFKDHPLYKDRKLAYSESNLFAGPVSHKGDNLYGSSDSEDSDQETSKQSSVMSMHTGLKVAVKNVQDKATYYSLMKKAGTNLGEEVKVPKKKLINFGNTDTLETFVSKKTMGVSKFDRMTKMPRQALARPTEMQSIQRQVQLTDRQEVPINVHKVYIQASLRKNQPPLPVLFKIREQSLKLPRYTLNEAAAFSLAKSLKEIKDQQIIIRSAYFERNKLTDQQLAPIIKQLLKQTDFKSLTIKDNQFGEECLKQLLPCLDLQSTNAMLIELSLAHCRVNPASLIKLLSLLATKNVLQKVSFAGVIQDEHQLNELNKVIKNNDSIQEYDLSWNKFSPAGTSILLEQLRDTKTIKNLNLSWINLGSARLTAIEKFSEFIFMNRQLMHLDLSSTNLGKEYLLKIITNIKKSLSLQAVHLCGCKIPQECMDLIKQKLKPTQLPSQKHQHQNKVEKQVKEFMQHKIPHYEQMYSTTKFKDAINEYAKLPQQYHQETCKCFILTRVLGHPEILNSHYWKITDACWICQKWKYTIVFYKENQSDKLTLIDNQEGNLQTKKKVSKTLAKNNQCFESIKNKIEPENTYISGSFTNWKVRRMLAFAELIALKEGDLESFNNKESVIYYRKQIFSQYKSKLQKLFPYQDIQLVNLVEELPQYDHYKDEVYVHCQFVPPGRHNYLVMDKDYTMYQDSFVQKPFKDTYHNHLKIAKTAISTKKNTIRKSVFKDFKTMDIKLLRAGLLEEMQYWRVPKFVKDEQVCEDIKNFICKHAEMFTLKWVQTISQSNFPVLSWLDYQSMVEGLGLLDEDLSTLQVDTIFIAANVKNGALKQMPDRDLSRYQFLESLIRIVDTKYIKTKKVETHVQGLQLLLDRFKSQDLHATHRWRTEELWCLEVDELLKANMRGLQKLYRFYVLAEQKKFLQYKDCMNLMTQDTKVAVLDKEAIFAYGQSKQIVYNDITQRSQYDKVEMVEFLEFIARVAVAKYKETSFNNEPLVNRIGMILDLILPLVGMKKLLPVEAEPEYISVSESELQEENYYNPYPTPNQQNQE